jgi:PAS domain S-box-containing protein
VTWRHQLAARFPLELEQRRAPWFGRFKFDSHRVTPYATIRGPTGAPMWQDLQKQVLPQQSGLAITSRPWIVSAVFALALGVTYFLAARLSLALLTKPDGVAVFWPAAGVAAGTLIAVGPPARWPVVAGAMAATLIANLLGDRTIWSAIVFAVCNAGEAVIVAALIERYFGADFDLGRLGHVLGFLAAVVAGTAISGIGGTLGYVLFHSSTAPALTIWYHWFTSDALGIITVAPLLIGLVAAARDPVPRHEIIEGSTALATLTLLSAVAILLPRESWATIVPIAALFPLLLWLAARCRPVFAAAAAFIVALTIVWTTTFAIGIFGDTGFPVTHRILAAQAGILAVSLCAFVLAALFAERRQHEAVLTESEARLQQALTAGGVAAFDWDVHSDKSRRSENAAGILGYDPKQNFSGAEFFARVHKDERARFLALVRGLRSESPSFDASFRFIRPDGREIWLEQTAKGEFDAAGRLARLKGLTLDITERKRAEEHQDRLTAELDHRIKNVLARVAVVAKQTREGSSTMDQFVWALEGRIQSMAAAHSLLSLGRWHGVGLADLVRDQLAPYATGANVTVSGPNIMLSVAATQALAMVLHELVTNAAKYGALSTPDGRVSVSWEQSSGNSAGETVTIAWREIGGAPVVSPSHFGFGTNLIRELIPHELGGSVELAFGPEGVNCVIEVPVESEPRPSRI